MTHVNDYGVIVFMRKKEEEEEEELVSVFIASGLFKSKLPHDVGPPTN